tara:strand:- start:18 stop:221 length:204 start_codon:yes stop_codon:yes gene_type:complete
MKFVSISKACEMLDISDTTLYRLLSLGNKDKRRIHSVLMGNKRKIEITELEDFMKKVMEEGKFQIEH